MTDRPPVAAGAAWFLARQSPIVDIVRPYVEGDAQWPATMAALVGFHYAEVYKPTVDELMGRDGGDYIYGREPGDAPEPGTWYEVVAAQNYGLLTAEEVMQVLVALVAKSGKAAPAGKADAAPATDAASASVTPAADAAPTPADAAPTPADAAAPPNG